MSHQAYSWVLEHGPRLDTVDRTGAQYGTRARAMRAVLSSIANAANADGENSHPGLATMISESLYSKAHVLKIIAELVEERWLEVTEEGRGRGHATVFRIRMDREKVSPRDHSETGKGLIGRKKRSHPDDEKVSSGAGTPLFSTDTTKPVNVSPDPTPSDQETQTPRQRAAHQLTVLAFEQPVKPTIAGANGKAFVAVMGLFEKALTAGRTVNELRHVVEAGVDVWTTQGLNTAIAQQRHRPSRGSGLLDLVEEERT